MGSHYQCHQHRLQDARRKLNAYRRLAGRWQRYHQGVVKDLGKDNITVNSICIGLIKSGQMERRYDRLKGDDPNLTLEDVWVRGARNQNIPLGRVGEPEEAGDVIAFMASARSSFVNGVALNLDGGASPAL